MMRHSRNNSVRVPPSTWARSHVTWMETVFMRRCRPETFVPCLIVFIVRNADAGHC
jgi:hypothetical protein